MLLFSKTHDADADTHLRSGRPGNHARGGVLDLHLVQEDVAVLGQLDLAGAADQHLEGAAGAEVGLEDVLEAAGGGHVDRPGLVLADDLGVGGELLQSGRHGCWGLAGWLAAMAKVSVTMAGRNLKRRE